MTDYIKSSGNGIFCSYAFDCEIFNGSVGCVVRGYVLHSAQHVVGQGCGRGVVACRLGDVFAWSVAAPLSAQPCGFGTQMVNDGTTTAVHVRVIGYRLASVGNWTAGPASTVVDGSCGDV